MGTHIECREYTRSTAMNQRVLARVVRYMEDWCAATRAVQPSRMVLAAAAVAVTGGAKATAMRSMKTLDDLCREPFGCANCSDRIDDLSRALESTYCSSLCGQEAAWVRSLRRRRAEGRDRDPEVMKTTVIRLALVLRGGYDLPEVPERVRLAVKDRERGQCRACGKPGTDIDHMDGDSAAMDNLQLLCKECHNRKTMRGFAKITFASKPEPWVHAGLLRARAGSKLPLQLCDDERQWEDAEPEVRRRRKLIRQPVNHPGFVGEQLV